MKNLMSYLVVFIMQMGLSLPGYCENYKSSLPAPPFDVSPDNINNLLKTGITQFRAGNTGAAENSFKEVLKIEPGNETAHLPQRVVSIGLRQALRLALHCW